MSLRTRVCGARVQESVYVVVTVTHQNPPSIEAHFSTPSSKTVQALERDTHTMDHKRKEPPPHSPPASKEQEIVGLQTALAMLNHHQNSSSSSSPPSTSSGDHARSGDGMGTAMDVDPIQQGGQAKEANENQSGKPSTTEALGHPPRTLSLLQPGGGKFAPGEEEEEENEAAMSIDSPPVAGTMETAVQKALREGGHGRYLAAVLDERVMRLLLEALANPDGVDDSLLALLAQVMSKRFRLYRDFDGSDKMQMSFMRHTGTSSLARYTPGCERTGMFGEENLWWKAGVTNDEIDTITAHDVRTRAFNVSSTAMTKWMEGTKEVAASHPAYAHEHSQRRGYGMQVMGAGNNEEKSDKGLTHVWLAPTKNFLKNALEYQATILDDHPSRKSELQLRSLLNGISNALTKLGQDVKKGDKMFGNTRCAGFATLAKAAGKRSEERGGGEYGSSTSVGQLFYHDLVQPMIGARGVSQLGGHFWAFLKEVGGKKGEGRWNATKADWTLITYEAWLEAGGRDLAVKMDEDAGQGPEKSHPPKLPTDVVVTTWDDFFTHNNPKQETALNLTLTAPTDKTVAKLNEKLGNK
jgi:hypothetical protein